MDQYFIVTKEVARERSLPTKGSDDGDGTGTDGADGRRGYKVYWHARMLFTLRSQCATGIMSTQCSTTDTTDKFLTVMYRFDVVFKGNTCAAPIPRYKCRACQKEINAQASITKAVKHKLVEGKCPVRVARPGHGIAGCLRCNTVNAVHTLNTL